MSPRWPVDPEAVLAELRDSRRYGRLCEDALRRTALWAATGSSTTREAAKKAKRKLHQVYGAYVEAWKPGPAWPAAVAGPPPAADGIVRSDSPALRAACVQAMARHASTRERVRFLDRFYQEVFAISGTPRTVLDLGCGLHPLGIPWMGLPASSDYDTVDMDAGAVDAVRRFFAATGQAGTATCLDLLCPGEELPGAAGGRGRGRYDLAFVLKAVPCLEQQQRGAAGWLLRRVPAHRVVVSFALRTIGGGRRQSAAHYDRTARRLFADLGWAAARLLVGDELVFVADACPGGH